MTERRLTKCIHCNSFIDPKYGEDSPTEHEGHEGTEDDPRAPGEWDNICDYCNYGLGLRGSPQLKEKDSE